MGVHWVAKYSKTGGQQSQEGGEREELADILIFGSPILHLGVSALVAFSLLLL